MAHFIAIICSIQIHSKNLYAETKGDCLLKYEISFQHYIWQIKHKKLHVYFSQKIIPHLTTLGTAVKLKKPFHSPNHGISKITME